MPHLGEYWALLLRYLRPQGRRALGLAGLLLASIALQVINPQILRGFIDSAQDPQGDLRGLVIAAGLFIGIALLTQLLGLGAAYLSEQVAWAATNDMRADLTLHCLRLDMGFHKARTPGELIERVDGDVAALANFFSQFVIRVLGNGILMLAVLVVLLREEYRIGLSLAALAGLLSGALIGLQRVVVPLWARARESSAALFGFIEERLSGTEDIRSSGAVGYTLRRLDEHSRARLHAERRAHVIGASAWLTPQLFFVVAGGLTYWLGERFFRAGSMSLGTVYLIFFYTEALLRPVIQITRQIEDLQKAGAGIVRIRELYRIQPGLADGTRELPEGPLAVEFAGVGFAYNDAGDGGWEPAAGQGALPTPNSQLLTPSSVLEDISFTLPAGRVLGILGRTGSGKTTLTRLLFRLYDPTSGSIRLGGADLRAVRSEHLRQRVGMVTQDVQLFHASVRDNLTFFDPSIPDQHILAVLHQLELGQWYQALPNGLDTVLAAGGGGLSAGEAQVLAFTRVFLRNPSLVLLDEASSRLDPATERLIERAVGQLLQGRTGIIIAHRLATLLRADDILILEGGRIREYGPRAALMADPASRFAELLRVGLEEVLV